MVIATSTLIASITAAAAVAGTVSTVRSQRAATKQAKRNAEQTQQAREAERKRSEELIAKGEALPAQAKETAAIAAGKKRKRGTLATSPRGLLDEPAVSKPTLLG